MGTEVTDNMDDDQPLGIEQAGKEILVTTADNLRAVGLMIKEYLERERKEKEELRTRVQELADAIDENNRLLKRRNHWTFETSAKLWVLIKKILAYAAGAVKDVMIDDE